MAKRRALNSVVLATALQWPQTYGTRRGRGSQGHRDTKGEELTRGRNTSLVSGGRRGRQSRGVGLPKDSPLQDTDGLSFREEYR